MCWSCCNAIKIWRGRWGQRTAAAMPLHDAPHRRQTDAVPFELRLIVQALERPEQLVGVGRIESGAIVGQGETGYFGIDQRLQADPGRIGIAGRPFLPGPSGEAADAAAPFRPVGFSALIDRETTPGTALSSLSSM